MAYGDIRDFRNQINQIYWDCCCSDREFFLRNDRVSDEQNYKEQYWILEPEYQNSRTKVIGNAIADCVTGEKEFKDKDKKPGDIITFEGTNPETYKQKHWNAFILYNYINEVINGGNDGDVAEVLKDKLDELKKNYRGKYGEAIDKAVAYIQDYVYALDLYGELIKFRDSKQRYDTYQETQDIAPCKLGAFDNKQLTMMNNFYTFNNAAPNTIWKYQQPCFRYEGNQLYLADLYMTEDNYIQGVTTSESYWRSNPPTHIAIDDIEEVKKLDSKLALCKPLLERLDGLVKAPTKEMVAQWQDEKSVTVQEVKNEEN